MLAIRLCRSLFLGTDSGGRSLRISNIKLTKFRRFAALEIKDIPASAKLVVLAGPNGSGKSSLFDAMLIRYRTQVGMGWNGDERYYNNQPGQDADYFNRVVVTTHAGEQLKKGDIYIRSAHRHDPDFVAKALTRQGDALENYGLNRLIDQDATVSSNYQRMASRALEDVFVKESSATTIGDYREKLIGEVREPILRLFPGLRFLGVGNPLDKGTFQFEKGASLGFDYKNLSGGEKSAFDLIVDFVVKRQSYTDAVYCIDEPELHLNTKVQGALLAELLALIPGESQLWIASHSIGMMRKAREIYAADPASVVFLDFGDRDFDQATIIEPTKPTRAFWANVLHVALDDLASLVAPSEVVICEGNPVTPVQGKNVEHDARIYSTIFADEMPDVTFVSAGSANQVSGDFLALASTLPKVARGMLVRRVIDLDDHAPADVIDYKQQGITVLGRRHIEAYLFDDEVLVTLCNFMGKSADAPAVLTAKAEAVADSVARGNPADDIKSAAGKIYTETKRILGLTQAGNDRHAFARNTLAPLIKPGMAVYAALKQDIFGV